MPVFVAGTFFGGRVAASSPAGQGTGSGETLPGSERRGQLFVSDGNADWLGTGGALALFARELVLDPKRLLAMWA